MVTQLVRKAHKKKENKKAFLSHGLVHPAGAVSESDVFSVTVNRKITVYRGISFNADNTVLITRTKVSTFGNNILQFYDI